MDPGFILYVKASTRDCKSLGADIMCHRIMMMLALKDLKNHGQIMVIDMIKKTNYPDKFPFSQLPGCVLQVEGSEVEVEDSSEIEERLEDAFQPPLKSTNDQVNAFVTIGPGCTVYHKFNQFIKNRDSSQAQSLRAHLLTELKKVNNFLLSTKMPLDGAGKRRYLCGEKPGLPDCYLLPKLHYMYVALGVVKEFPLEPLAGIEAYLELGRKHPAFKNTCPDKPDIVHFFCRQANFSESETLKKCDQVSN